MVLDFVAQDGTRIRASASAPSFRREASLLECREQAALHVKAVLAEADDPESTASEKAARLAAAHDYERRVLEAIETVTELRESGKEKPRASTTDEQARMMKMGCTGLEPGYVSCPTHNSRADSVSNVFLVRGLDKVTSVALLVAIASNILTHAVALLA